MGFAQSLESQKEFETAMVPVVERLAGSTPIGLDSPDPFKTLELQKFGDYIVQNAASGEAMRIEFKFENKFTGNLFIEEWSNRKTARQGWFLTLQTDWLYYGFGENRRVYMMRFPRLKQWLWTPDPQARNHYRIDLYSRVMQRATEQQNETWGWLVPITDLQQAGLIEHEMEW